MLETRVSQNTMSESKLKTEKIDIEVDKVHALVIKEYEGMVIDVFTKKPVERFMKPLHGYRVAKLTITLEELPPLEKKT